MPRAQLFIIPILILAFTSQGIAASKPSPSKAPTVKPAAAKPLEVKPEASQLKQFELAKRIVDALGFSEGLPSKPVEKDYLDILGGNRTFRFEAENCYDTQSDAVSVRDYPLYGAFSGKGWIHAATTPTAVHFKIFIPVSGKYSVKVSSKGDEQLWSIAGKAFRLNAGANFKDSTLGQVFIPAGELEFNAVIPPAGAIDYFTFTAPSYSPIEPLAGWSPSSSLKSSDVNEVIAAIMGLEQMLPDDSRYRTKIIEAASLQQLPETVYTTDNQVLGKPVSTKWLRAFPTGATVAVPLEIESSSVYRIRLRAVGTEIKAGFGERIVTAALKPYLEWVDLGTFRLPKGANSLKIQLPPTGGVDLIEITRKLSSPNDYAVITKSDRKNDAEIKPEELDAIVKSLQGQFKERR